MPGVSDLDERGAATGLVLRSLTLTDVPAMASLMARNREHIGRYMRAPSEVAGDLVRLLCSTLAAEQRGEVITVVVEVDSALAGLFTLVPMSTPVAGHEYIGWVGTKFVRRRAGQACLTRLCGLAQEQGIDVVHARIRSDNAPMNALARAAGFVPVEPIESMGNNDATWWLLRRDAAAEG